MQVIDPSIVVFEQCYIIEEPSSTCQKKEEINATIAISATLQHQMISDMGTCRVAAITSGNMREQADGIGNMRGKLSAT